MTSSNRFPLSDPGFSDLACPCFLTVSSVGVAAGVAFIQIGVNVALASVCGCIIGFLILSLDSWLVAPTARGRRIITAAPRVVLALLFGAIFSTPIAIGILGPEIQQQLTVIKESNQAAFLQQQSASLLNKEINTLQAEFNNLQSIIDTGGGTTLNPSSDPTLRSLENQLKEAQTAETSAFENWQCQLYGTSTNGNRCIAGTGALAQAAQQQYEADLEKVDRLNAQIAAREQQLTSSDTKARHARVTEAKAQLPGVKLELEKDQQALAEENANFTAANNSDNGLLIKVQALSELTGSNKSIRYYILFLFFLIILLQCLPVLLKIVQRSGPYEMELEAALRQEALRSQYRMRAAEGALLEQVLDRESLTARPTPATRPAVASSAATPPAAVPLSLTWPLATTDGTLDESEDATLRDMQDMRAMAHPDAGQTADWFL